MADRLRYVGTWLSLVEHSLGVRGVGSSNLPVPTIRIKHLENWILASRRDLRTEIVEDGCRSQVTA